MSVVAALQRAPLFKDFSESGLETLAAIAQERVIPAGMALFLEDAVGESLFVVKSGEVRLTQRAPGAVQVVGTVGPGDHLGDLALLARTVRLVTATAVTECEVIELARRDFFKKAQEKPVTCLKLAAVVAGELAKRVGAARGALRDALARTED
jgi:CRP-like cAMP-binding protein